MNASAARTGARLLADVGGTNARFAWQAEPGSAFGDVVTLPCADHATLADAISTYLTRLGHGTPRECAIAIANPVTGDQVKMTNHHWAFSIAALKAQCGFERLRVLNDFTALALALPALRPDELRQVGGGAAVPDEAIALIGPGTGLGVSGLLPDGRGGWVALQGEGGHATLAGRTPREQRVLDQLDTRYGHASAERAVCGQGLVDIHAALQAIDAPAAPVTARTAASIVEGALERGDAGCLEAVNLFCAFLGTAAGNLALTLGARGGVYIGGGIVPRLGEAFDQSPFRKRFESKGRFAGFLAALPVFVIVARQSPALLGAARALDQTTRSIHPEEPPVTDDAVIDSIRHASHGDPFAVLGMHADAHGQRWLRAFLPGAAQVQARAADGVLPLATLTLRHADGFFEGRLPADASNDYRLHVQWQDGNSALIDDPYRFPAVLGDMDVWLMGEGTHLRPYEVLGATARDMLGVAGTSFAVWAPNASRVSVVGDFNFWDGRRHPMRLRRECGVWEIFLPGVGVGARYKYEIRTRDGHVLTQKADPYALQSELRPATASVVARMPAAIAPSEARRKANALDAPMSIYEVHLGSWRRRPEEGDRWLNWDELADTLVPYTREIGFTHLELLPVSEHPFDGSWGYQPIGMYAPTSRFGDPAGFRRFVDRCHAEGVGLILDWVPAHFPTDAHGLANFDGTHLYEYADPREGFHQDWNTLIYNLGRTEVRNFLVGNALYWLERYGVDGLRVDAVASMLYRDYSRKHGEWVPNVHGGRENLEAIAFLKRMNEVVGSERPQAVTLAEESTAFPAVSRPTFAGGLGFHYKWNMGWMHDTLQYIARDPVHRKYHHGEITFSLVYAFNENFVLPISHDEVVHGKGSMLTKMPGDAWQKFANLRAYYGFMWGHPGKKLLFMGSEFAQGMEWNHEQSLDWHQLEIPAHAGVQRLLKDLNALYKATPALYQRDFDGSGFEWIDHDDAEHSALSFIRRGHSPDALVVVVCNFTPSVQHGYRIGVPHPGVYKERINTDSAHYGGSNVGAPFGEITAQPLPAHGRPYSIELALPPLAAVFFEWNA